MAKQYKVIMQITAEPEEMKAFRDSLDKLTETELECSCFDVYGLGEHSDIYLNYGEEDFKE